MIISPLPEIRKLAEIVTETAFSFVERRLLLSSNPLLKKALQALEETYDLANTRRIRVECKRLKFELCKTYNLRPGSMALLKSNLPVKTGIPARHSRPGYQKWLTIPEGEYVLYLDVVPDQNFDVPTLQLLWGDKIVFLHQDSRVHQDLGNLGDFLEKVQTK